MDKETVTLTVYFEDPFWVGLFEKIVEGKLSVCKVTFGAEPKEYEVLEHLLKNYSRLKFSPTVAITEKNSKVNPKRMQRIARKQTLEKGIGTKSQQALQLQREESKQKRKELSKEKKEAEKQRLFEIKQQKRKEKHRGR